jgi:transposase-like protein
MAGIKGMKTYPLVIKQEAIRLFFEEGKTKKQIMDKLGIKNDTQLECWFRAFRKDGILGLPEKRKGRPPKIAATTTFSTEQRINQLEMENELLRNFLSETARWW